MRHLGGLSLDAVEYGPICRLAEPALPTSLLIMLVPHAEAFGAEVKCIAKGLVDALQGIPAGHEHLLTGELDHCRPVDAITLSNAVEQARGWVATKIGFCDMITSLIVLIASIQQ